jgi:hypothetical protein
VGEIKGWGIYIVVVEVLDKLHGKSPVWVRLTAPVVKRSIGVVDGKMSLLFKGGWTCFFYVIIYLLNRQARWSNGEHDGHMCSKAKLPPAMQSLNQYGKLAHCVPTCSMSKHQ